MTIVIAIATSDAVVLMADGRHANRIEIINDSAQKIFSLGDQLTLGVCGAVAGTELAVEDLRQMSHRPPEKLADHLANLSRTCADHVWGLVTTETQASANVRVGLIAGGFEGDQAFLAGGLFGMNMAIPDRQLLFATPNEPQLIVLGGEIAGSNQFFVDRLGEVLVQRAQRGLIDREAWISAILESGIETTRRAGEQDRTIGGRIHYRVLRNGLPEQLGEA